MHCIFDHFRDWMNLCETVAWQRKFEWIKNFFICRYFVWWSKDTSSGMDKRDQPLCSREFCQIIGLTTRPIDNRIDFHWWQQPYARKIADLLSLTHTDDLVKWYAWQQTRHSPIAWQQPLAKKFNDLLFTKQVKNVLYWILFFASVCEINLLLIRLWFFRTLWKPYGNLMETLKLI